uniref:Ubiquitin carboxyl-terminal hydrolase n=1 Tax=Auxenochlorella protothecoides TaxID=3075 RepID=A0A1D2AGD0_AUXPR
MSGEAWTTIESDPGVFTELIERLGVKGVQVEELYSLDADSLQAFEPIYGLIFLFKWQAEPVARPMYPEYEERGIFFAKQVINNACATQAILSILLNRPELDIGEELSQFRDFTAGFPADLRGEAIGNSETIREVHNSFTAPHALLPENPETDSEGEAFHFVAYTHRDGSIWELDGLQPGPVCLGEAGQV